MARARIERDLLAILMESPLYFTIPLRRRLEFIRFFSQEAVYELIWKHNKHLKRWKSNRRRVAKNRVMAMETRYSPNVPPDPFPASLQVP
jgi:hypothetical protein